MNKLTLGILAHVDAGKTTLSEALLYLTGRIRQLGRVDNKNAFLDTFALEKARGITIFSKQAIIPMNDNLAFTLLDTPGHVDFSAEMERTLQVLDYAILVVSGPDGVQGHTQTLWSLLNRYQIPTIIFVNKMDQNGVDSVKVLEQLHLELSDQIVDFSDLEQDAFYENLALCDESLLTPYLEKGIVDEATISTAIGNRMVYPCFFGSALKLEGVDGLLKGLETYATSPTRSETFGAKVFKVTRDEQGNRLTHLKVTGGVLKVKDALSYGDIEEKVNQIRVYSGSKYEALNEAPAGTICAVTGLTQSRPGDNLGDCDLVSTPQMTPVLSYQILVEDQGDVKALYPKLKLLEEEEPEYKFAWHETSGEVTVQIMGEVQLEILQSIVKERFQTVIHYDEGSIVYKETLTSKVEGVGHFEPLRHYAEVHLILEPLPEGSGIVLENKCNEDTLSKNYQRLVLTHLNEKQHKGVLIGADITDMKITLVSGRAHNTHTQGGDFREATFRAVRQGLKEASTILLEPYYQFELTVPEGLVGRAMTDVDQMHGSCEVAYTDGKMSVLTGFAPVATMRNYALEVIAYTKGVGKLFLKFGAYKPCHNSEWVISQYAYDSEQDTHAPTGSVFCTKGAGFYVPWNEVKSWMHLEACYEVPKRNGVVERHVTSGDSTTISLDEIEAILSSTYYANQGKKEAWMRKEKEKNAYKELYQPSRTWRPPTQHLKAILLVDGYNIIFAWSSLKGLAEENMDSAKAKLLDTLSNYSALKKIEIIVVFDAYKVKGRRESVEDYANLKVVYTGEAQTADSYIEKFAYAKQDQFHVTVATSDGLQQMIVRGAGCDLISARELEHQIELENAKLREDLQHEATHFNQNTTKIGDLLKPKS